MTNWKSIPIYNIYIYINKTVKLVINKTPDLCVYNLPNSRKL